MADVMRVPFFKVNVLTGIKGAKILEDPKACANLIRKAKRPLMVIGARAIEHFIGDKLHLKYCLELTKKAGILHLKFQDWKGVKKKDRMGITSTLFTHSFSTPISQ